LRLQGALCFNRWSIKEAAARLDNEKKEEKLMKGTMTPNPPRRGGDERNSLSVGAKCRFTVQGW